MSSNSPDVLDQVQLRRIEAVHRGFLYQHLYAVACLLRLNLIGATFLIVESDEDIELQFSDKRIYVQVKTRAQQLDEADISDALSKFEKLRKEHNTGARSGSASFIIVSNVAPGPKLRERTRATGWPADVQLSRRASHLPTNRCRTLGGTFRKLLTNARELRRSCHLRY
ncbi:MAG TPA: dsDNA nuclease domain-containing protein [Rhizomicrobium sp.]|jgi:hypothetical protein|nr:dsDNA nuclease domain-containing protein [Rhizomicrobium sp.]